MLRHSLSLCTCTGGDVCTHTSTWCGLGLAGNVNSLIWRMYLGITCDLIQPWEILGVWGIYHRGL